MTTVGSWSSVLLRTLGWSTGGGKELGYLPSNRCLLCRPPSTFPAPWKIRTQKATTQWAPGVCNRKLLADPGTLIVQGVCVGPWKRWLDGITHSMDVSLSKLGDSEGEGSLECCSPWGHKESNVTDWLNYNSKYLLHQVLWVIQKARPPKAPLIASTSSSIRDEYLSFLLIFPLVLKRQPRSLDEFFWDFRTRFGNYAHDLVFLHARGHSFSYWMGIIREWWLESALPVYQNKWVSQLGKEYIQRTGGWEHLCPEVANEMGKMQIGAGKKFIPWCFLWKNRLGTLGFFINVKPWSLGGKNFIKERHSAPSWKIRLCWDQ